MEIKNWILETAGVVIASLVTFFSTKRKYKQETKSLEYQNVQMMLSTYRSELEAMNLRINEYVAKIKEYVAKIDDLENKVDQLLHENKELKSIISDFEKKYGKHPKTKNIIDIKDESVK